MSKRKAFIFCCWTLLAISPATASQGRGSVVLGGPAELPGLIPSTGTSVFPCDERTFIINPNPRGVSPAATLTSLQVSPAMTEIRGIGAGQPFGAVGTYSDGSTRCLTALVTWSSSDSSVATISNGSGTNGLATAYGYGLTMITAAFEYLNSSALLTVNPIWCRSPNGQEIETRGGQSKRGGRHDDVEVLAWQASLKRIDGVRGRR